MLLFVGLHWRYRWNAGCSHRGHLAGFRGWPGTQLTVGSTDSLARQGVKSHPAGYRGAQGRLASGSEHWGFWARLAIHLWCVCLGSAAWKQSQHFIKIFYIYIIHLNRQQAVSVEKSESSPSAGFAFCIAKQFFWCGQQRCIFRIQPTQNDPHFHSAPKSFYFAFQSNVSFHEFNNQPLKVKARRTFWLWELLSLRHKVHVKMMTGFQGCQKRVSLEVWRRDGVSGKMKADRRSPIGRKLSDWWVFSGRLLSWTWFRQAGWLPHLSLLLKEKDRSLSFFWVFSRLRWHESQTHLFYCQHCLMWAGTHVSWSVLLLPVILVYRQTELLDF